jgi:hypothetical protein
MQFRGVLLEAGAGVFEHRHPLFEVIGVWRRRRITDRGVSFRVVATFGGRRSTRDAQASPAIDRVIRALRVRVRKIAPRSDPNRALHHQDGHGKQRERNP